MAKEGVKTPLSILTSFSEMWIGVRALQRNFMIFHTN